MWIRLATDFTLFGGPVADKVKLSKDGNSIDFVQSENIPTSVKKFRQSPEIEGFYRFVFENDLQKEAFEILDRISAARKAKKQKEKQDAQPAKKAETLKTETKTAKDIKQSDISQPKAVKVAAKPAVASGKTYPIKTAGHAAKVVIKPAAKKPEMKKPAGKKK